MPDFDPFLRPVPRDALRGLWDDLVTRNPSTPIAVTVRTLMALL